MLTNKYIHVLNTHIFTQKTPPRQPLPSHLRITPAPAGALNLRIALPFQIIELSFPLLYALLPPRFVLILLHTNPLFRCFQPLSKFPRLIPLLSPALELGVVTEAVPVPIAVAHMLRRTIHGLIRVPLQRRGSENEMPDILHHSPRDRIAERGVRDPFPPLDVSLLGMLGYS